MESRQVTRDPQDLEAEAVRMRDTLLRDLARHNASLANSMRNHDVLRDLGLHGWKT